MYNQNMRRKRAKKRHFVVGKDFRTDGHTRITKGDDFLVHGGTKITHEETVHIVNEFSKRLGTEGTVDPKTAGEILKSVLEETRRRN